ncbi:MAG: serine/threonine protein kinase [Marmoricola sp.]|nr:serine/threonine protein kinase [Marmoricola sp.]
MTTRSIGAGTLLSGRYELEDLLSDIDGACFWRATDTVLARNVAIHAVPSDDPRADRLMEAARRSATVADPRVLRVLDADDRDGVTWVVNEWGEGISLDTMLERGPLPASRAAWLTLEVAETIAHGHAQGVAHGRLRPESVLVTDSGAVKLVGYVVDASLEPTPTTDPSYGELEPREADVIDLAGLLYAALTGRWPGVAPSRLPDAPREAHRPLRPRQVRAGVPRTLDALCDRVLHQEATQHAMPIETAHEIAAALADYVGDPSRAAPLDAAGMHSEVPPPAALPDPEPEPWLDPPTRREAAPEAATGTAAGPEARTDLFADPYATQLSAAVDPVDTAIRREPLESPDALDSFAAPVQAAPPPPPFEELPERPLFATTERRVPAAAAAPADGRARWGEDTSSSAAPPDHRVGGPGASTTGFWALSGADDAPPVHTGREGRGWFRTAVAVGLLLVLLVSGLVALHQLRDSGGATASTDDTDSTPATSTTGRVIRAVGVRDFDPQGSPSTENPETVRNAIDTDPATTWMTKTYRGNPALGGLKDGVGLIVDLGRDQQVGSVDVRFVGAPTSFTVYAATGGVSAFPTSLDQFDQVGQRQGAGTQARVALRGSPRTRYVLVWLTRLPAAAGGYRGEVATITVRS